MTTPSRIVIIAGNWKMHYGPRQASRFALEVVPELGLLVHQNPHILSILCPPAISLSAVREVMDAHLYRGIELGAQNMYFEEKGAYTGEISPPMVRELCTTVILGHSERRTYFGETDELVNKKALAAFNHNLRPIICIGEHLEEYEAGKTEEVIRFQVQHSFAQFPAQHVKKVVVAYEPIWAIGTGKAATAEGAGNVIHLMRGSSSTAHPVWWQRYLRQYQRICGASRYRWGACWRGQYQARLCGDCAQDDRSDATVDL